MDVKELLPIGSVVLLEGAEKKLNIIGIKQTSVDTGEEFDYLSVTYPEGFINAESMLFFNHESIAEVCFVGMQDSERTEFITKLDEYFQNQE